jgi:uncharacterized protein YbaR (Trm112 family)
MDLLACPACHGGLDWKIQQQSGEHIQEAEAHCLACDTRYPVHEGIAVFLTTGLERADLWEQVESNLGQYLRQNPNIEKQLLGVPLEALAPTDQELRAGILQERGAFEAARQARETASGSLYGEAYLSCSEEQVNFVVERLAGTRGPVVDLASGRGTLVEILARRLTNPIVATDFSPLILRRTQQWLDHFGLGERVSYLAFDARRSPFRDAAVSRLTTYLGLINIQEPGVLFDELRRIVSGEFLAISTFYPEEDEANASAIRQLGVEQTAFRRALLQNLSAAGFEANLASACAATALPTPESVLINGVRLDALPVTQTMLEWGVVIGR